MKVLTLPARLGACRDGENTSGHPYDFRLTAKVKVIAACLQTPIQEPKNLLWGAEAKISRRVKLQVEIFTGDIGRAGQWQDP